MFRENNSFQRFHYPFLYKTHMSTKLGESKVLGWPAQMLDEGPAFQKKVDDGGPPYTDQDRGPMLKQSHDT